MPFRSEVEDCIKNTMDDALAAEEISRAIYIVVVDALTQATVFDALLAALKYHKGYKQYLTNSIACS